jgi:phospholipid transport system substrate-binding protein
MNAFSIDVNSGRATPCSLASLVERGTSVPSNSSLASRSLARERSSTPAKRSSDARPHRLLDAILWVALLVVAVAWSAPSRGASDPASDQVQRAVDEALQVLRDPALAEKHEERLNRIRTIADRIFDWDEISRRSLGEPWRRLDGAQRRRFIHTFTDRIAEKYMQDIDRFRGDEQVTVVGSEPLGADRRVDTVLVTHSRERVPIDYFMYRAPTGWRVYDFSVEGVSLVGHYRNTLGRYLTNHSFDQLMERIERHGG